MTWTPSNLTREQLEERRLEGGWLLRAGQISQAEIARHLNVSRASVSAWAKIMRTAGLRGLRRRKAAGSALKLTPAQKQRLKRLLDRGALACGFETDRWTLQRVAELIQPEFKVTYHPHYLNRLLASLGYSPQKPLPRAVEQDEALVQAWLSQDWPRIKKARRHGATIVFFDEFGFSFQEPLATTWARIGKRPVLRRVTRDRRALSTAAALTLSGQIVKRHFKGSIKSAQVIATLQHVQRHVPGPLILIWDRARPHRSQSIRTYLTAHPEIVVEELPAYAPELNLEEYCHGNVKHHLKNARPKTKDEIRASLDRGFQRLRRRPDLLLSFFHAAGLTVKQLWLT